MKRLFVSLLLFIATYSAFAQNGTVAGGGGFVADSAGGAAAGSVGGAAPGSAGAKKFFRGIEGGVVFNTGYSFENFPQIGYHGGGVPLGVGGRGLAILGDHLRAGGEGFMNTMSLDGNGSESIYAFGGAMADFCWTFGPVLAYVGANIGGGIFKTYIATQKPSYSWEQVGGYHNKQFVWATNPYLGAQIKIARKLSIIVQVSYTVPLNGDICREFNCLNTSIGLEFGG